jgi:uncharacterized lipoprotein
MIKKIALLLTIILMASCNSTRPVVRTTSKSKPKTTTTKKPVVQNTTSKNDYELPLKTIDSSQ